MVKVMEDNTTDAAANHYTFTIAGAADEITAGLVKGDFDVAAVPCNLASVLYNKTKGQIKLAGVNTLGVLYIVETGDRIHSVADLKGKTIYSTGLGTTPQYTLNYILSANNIDPEKDVTVEYKTEATEVAALLSDSSDAIAMLPQPYVTTVMMNNDKIRIALDVAKEWDAVSKDGSSVVTGVVVVRSEFLEKNKDAFDAFLKEYEASAAYVNENTEDASALVEKFDIFKAAVIKKAIPYCNITLLEGEDMKTKVNGYLTSLFNQNPQSIGGALPADDFYYMR
jgi:NitT/TauT family transport system substrate-binding protein